MLNKHSIFDLQESVGQTEGIDPVQAVPSTETLAPVEQSQQVQNTEAGAQDKIEQAPSMEAVSVTDLSQHSTDIEALLKKIDYDPYNEDEVRDFPLTFMFHVSAPNVFHSCT